MKRILIFAIILVCMPVTASALKFEIFAEDLITTYQKTFSTESAENYFLSLLSKPYTEDFEKQTRGATNFFSHFGKVKAHFIVEIVEEVGIPQGIQASYFDGGLNGLDVNTNLSIEFSKPINALGFYGIDWGDAGGQMEMSISYLNGSDRDILIPTTVNAPTGSVFYFGLIDTENSITSTEFNKIGYIGDLMVFENLTIAKNSVSEPSTMLLLGSGLLGLIGLRRKFRK